MIVAGTGHRPTKLGGYSGAVKFKLLNLASNWIKINKPTKIISGMALGWDQALAHAALENNIQLIAAVPFPSFYIKWPEKEQQNVIDLLSQVSKIETISNDPYTAQKMQKRNEWMVDNCDVVLALWDGSSGGTKNCIDYATKKKRQVINLWGNWIKKPRFSEGRPGGLLG